MKAFIVAIFLFALAFSGMAADDGYPPWKFGMSKDEVESFKEFGPYRDFSNGDNETLNGQFHGRKANVQFFYESGRLHHIGIYLFEGPNVKEGVTAWALAYEALEKDYGKILAADIPKGKGGEPPTAESLAVGAAVLADESGRARVTPAKQPANMKVTLDFFAADVQGRKWFYVAIFLMPKDQI